MEDLLEEKDFIKNEPRPTPYRHYGIFMVISCIIVVINYAYGYYMKINGEDFFPWLELLAPLAMVLVMFLSKRKYLSLDLSQIVLGIFLYIISSLFSTVFINIVNPAGFVITHQEYWDYFIALMAVDAIQFIVCCVVMIIIALKFGKKHKAQKLH